MLYFFKPKQRITLFIRVVFRLIKYIAKYYHLSDKNYAICVFRFRITILAYVGFQFLQSFGTMEPELKTSK